VVRAGRSVLAVKAQTELARARAAAVAGQTVRDRTCLVTPDNNFQPFQSWTRNLIFYLFLSLHVNKPQDEWSL
jgi:hypothetical protein